MAYTIDYTGKDVYQGFLQSCEHLNQIRNIQYDKAARLDESLDDLASIADQIQDLFYQDDFIVTKMADYQIQTIAKSMDEWTDDTESCSYGFQNPTLFPDIKDTYYDIDEHENLRPLTVNSLLRAFQNLVQRLVNDDTNSFIHPYPISEFPTAHIWILLCALRDRTKDWEPQHKEMLDVGNEIRRLIYDNMDIHVSTYRLNDLATRLKQVAPKSTYNIMTKQDAREQLKFQNYFQGKYGIPLEEYDEDGTTLDDEDVPAVDKYEMLPPIRPEFSIAQDSGVEYYYSNQYLNDLTPYNLGIVCMDAIYDVIVGDV